MSSRSSVISIDCTEPRASRPPIAPAPTTTASARATSRRARPPGTPRNGATPGLGLAGRPAALGRTIDAASRRVGAERPLDRAGAIRPSPGRCDRGRRRRAHGSRAACRPDRLCASASGPATAARLAGRAISEQGRSSVPSRPVRRAPLLAVQPGKMPNRLVEAPSRHARARERAAGRHPVVRTDGRGHRRGGGLHDRTGRGSQWRRRGDSGPEPGSEPEPGSAREREREREPGWDRAQARVPDGTGVGRRSRAGIGRRLRARSGWGCGAARRQEAQRVEIALLVCLSTRTPRWTYGSPTSASSVGPIVPTGAPSATAVPFSPTSSRDAST